MPLSEAVAKRIDQFKDSNIVIYISVDGHHNETLYAAVEVDSKKADLRREWSHLWKGSYFSAIKIKMLSFAEIPHQKEVQLKQYVYNGIQQI